MKSLPEMINRWVPGGLTPLGTDGFGRSENRAALRRFFEVDAECIALAALDRLAQRGEVKPARVIRRSRPAPATWFRGGKGLSGAAVPFRASRGLWIPRRTAQQECRLL